MRPILWRGTGGGGWGGLSDEFASLPVKLSAVETKLGRGQTQTHGGNNPSQRVGEAGHPQPTHSPLPGFNLIQGWFFFFCFFCHAAPAPALQGKPVLQAPLKPVNKGCRGCRKGLVLLSDCTWTAVIKWAIHPALPFRGSPTGVFGGIYFGEAAPLWRSRLSRISFNWSWDLYKWRCFFF